MTNKLQENRQVLNRFQNKISNFVSKLFSEMIFIHHQTKHYTSQRAIFAFSTLLFQDNADTDQRLIGFQKNRSVYLPSLFKKAFLWPFFGLFWFLFQSFPYYVFDLSSITERFICQRQVFRPRRPRMVSDDLFNDDTWRCLSC